MGNVKLLITERVQNGNLVMVYPNDITYH